MTVENLGVSFPPARRGGARIRVVRGLHLAVHAGQTLAVVGESGCGKSLTALSMLQLVPVPPGRYDSGRILWTPDPQRDPVDLLSLSERQMQRRRGNEIAMIFQEPMTSLNPVYTIGEQILEAIHLHRDLSRAEAIPASASTPGPTSFPAACASAS